MPELDEAAMCFLEEKIPELVDGAVKQAYYAALASGNSVLIAEDGHLVEIFPNGSKKIIKPISPRSKNIIGQKLRLK